MKRQENEYYQARMYTVKIAILELFTVFAFGFFIAVIF